MHGKTGHPTGVIIGINCLRTKEEIVTGSEKRGIIALTIDSELTIPS